MSRPAALLALIVLVALGFIASIASGKVWVPPSAWFADSPGGWIIFELRLPRAILGAAIGAVLGLSGAVLQGYLRNPLADPAIVGVSSSAALGAVAAIFFGIAVSPLVMFACAMAGAGIAMLALVALVGRAGNAIGFILAGSVLSSLAAALTAFLVSIAPDPFATQEIINWLMGALTDRGMTELVLALPFMAAGAVLLALTGRSLDLLNLGEEAALSLGLHAGRTRALIVGGLALAVGASVAATGVVGFVGLIVPHLLRPIFGQRPSALLLPSALGGAALLLFADSAVRLTPGAGEVRLGVAMALIGAPFFFALLLNLRRRAPWG